jgi:secondary thiamine-phosphate synthase enzyme
MITQVDFSLPPLKRGFHLITNIIDEKINRYPETGILNLFIKHTSAALTINENADPSVRHDFETFINSLVPESFPNFTHIYEGLDDMPAHIKASFIGQSISIPIKNHKLHLGTWQGIYLCEFRNNSHQRSITATIIS